MFRENHWVDLPSDILKSIMKRLFYADLLNFRAVCKPWNSIIRGEGGGGTVPLKQSPWLVIFDEIAPASTTSTTSSTISTTSSTTSLNNAWYGRNWKRTSTTTATCCCSCKLFDPVYKKTYIIDTTKNIDINLFLIQIVLASKHGWLLLLSSERFLSGYKLLFAYNPFSSVKYFIELPIMYLAGILLATFTSNPDDHQNCLFIILHDLKGQTLKISSCRRGEKSWCNRYLKYPVWFSLTDHSYRVHDCDCGRWIYSEGSIYNIFRFGLLMKLDTIIIMKWELMQSRHGDEDDVLHCSVVMNKKKLDELDDDDNDLLSKLEKDHFGRQGFVYHPFTTAGTEYESSCHTEKTSKIIKIDPPTSLI